MARLLRESYPLPEMDFAAKDWNQTEHERAMTALLNASKSLERGQVIGKMLTWPVADGQAWYLVTKEDPLTVQHVPYSDAWTVDPIFIRGLRRSDVLEMQERDRALAAIFGKSTPR